MCLHISVCTELGPIFVKGSGHSTRIPPLPFLHGDYGGGIIEMKNIT